MEPSYYSGRTLSPVISQRDARTELPSVGRVDHRQPGLLSLRVQRVYRILGREGLGACPIFPGKMASDGVANKGVTG